MKDDGQEVEDPNFSGGGFGLHLEEMVYGAWWGRDVDTVDLAQFSPEDGLIDLVSTTPNHDDEVLRLYGGLFLKFK